MTNHLPAINEGPGQIRSRHRCISLRRHQNRGDANSPHIHSRLGDGIVTIRSLASTKTCVKLRAVTESALVRLGSATVGRNFCPATSHRVRKQHGGSFARTARRRAGMSVTKTSPLAIVRPPSCGCAGFRGSRRFSLVGRHSSKLRGCPTFRPGKPMLLNGGVDFRTIFSPAHCGLVPSPCLPFAPCCAAITQSSLLPPPDPSCQSIRRNSPND